MSCGEIPISTAAEAQHLEVLIEGPDRANAGELYEAVIKFRSLRGEIEFLTGYPTLLISQNGQIVGRPNPGRQTIGFMVRTSPGHDAQLPLRGRLLGCPTAPPPEFTISPAANRPPLEPGTYELLAVIRWTKPEPRSIIVSQPRGITIT